MNRNDVGNQARLLLVEFIRGRMEAEGIESPVSDDELLDLEHAPQGTIFLRTDGKSHARCLMHRSKTTSHCQWRVFSNVVRVCVCEIS